MKFYICPDDPDVIAMAENIKESNNFLINTGNYIHEMKQCIKELISAIDNSTLCKECCDKDCACSDCPWFKAKSRGLELLKEAEE